ncbi:MAG: glycosyltransferase [bacterium]|nr:glycosyltransferase [bacterium]
MKIYNEEKIKAFEKKGEKKNVLIVSDAFYPLVGGATIVVDSLARSMSKFCNVIVVVPDGRGAEEFYTKIDYPVIACKGFLISKNIGCLGFPELDNKFKKVIKNLKIDVVHIHSYFKLAKFFIKFAKKNDIPLVIHGHSKFYEEYLRSSHSKIIAKMLTRGAMKQLNSADCVLPVSNGALERYNELGLKTKAIIVPNATELEYFKDQEFTSEMVSKFNIDLGCKKLCFLSRITKVKNIDLLVDMCQKLKLSKLNFKLYIIGFGEDENYLKDAVNKAGLENIVKFLGKVTDKKIKSALMQVMDLFVFPSLVDTSCLVKYEFASQKVPTLCVKNTGPSEDIVDGENGYIAEANGESFANKVIEIFANDKKYQEIKEKAYDSLGRSWDDVSLRLLQIYDEIIKNK